MTRVALVAVLAACGGASHKPPALPEAPVCTATGASEHMEVLLPQTLAAAKGLGALATDFDVSPDRLVLLADRDHMYLLGWGGVLPIEGVPGADSFAYTPDGLLLAIRGSQLEYLGESGALEPLFELPSAGMGLATGASGVMYLYDRKPTAGRYALYELTTGRRARKLFESPAPIAAVTQASGHVYVATGGSLYDATPGARMHLVISMQSGIQSAAADPATGKLYVSDGGSVVSVDRDCVASVTRTIGGTLRVRDHGLLVLDVNRRTLVRFAPLP